MKAIRVQRTGGPEVMELAEVRRPAAEAERGRGEGLRCRSELD